MVQDLFLSGSFQLPRGPNRSTLNNKNGSGDGSARPQLWSLDCPSLALVATRVSCRVVDCRRSMVPGSANESELKPEVTDIGSVSGSTSFALMSYNSVDSSQEKGVPATRSKRIWRCIPAGFRPAAYVGRRPRLRQMTSKNVGTYVIYRACLEALLEGRKTEKRRRGTGIG